MEAELIKKGLQQISTNRLNTIHIEYKVDCVNSNVHELHKQLKKAIEFKRIMVVKGKGEVELAEVVDMFNSLENTVKFYKVSIIGRNYQGI